MKTKGIWTAALLSTAAIAGFFIIACGGSSSSSGPGVGMATVSVSDPATCAGPSGPFAHVYVTITDVQANTSSSAGDNDSGWKDLTPSLSSHPKQVDLLGQANNQCFLATLGDAQELQAGNYQQIRLILAGDNTTVANNACGGSANCVVLSSDNSVHPLLLSSEAKTGLKIPSGQIANGGFEIAAGETKDLNIDFDTCASIVQEGNGSFRLKPVLHAGEVSTTSTSINGSVMDKTTGNPVAGNVLVALEQKDATGVDRIVMSTLAAPDGSFVFCPVPAGTYDVVIVAMGANGVAYLPSIVTGVANGQTTGNVDVWPGSSTQSTATLTGSVTSQNSSNAGTVSDIGLSALETISVGGTTFTIPLLPTTAQTSATLSVETSAPGGTSTCPSPNVDCATYSMVLPSGGPYIGAYSSAGTTLSAGAPLATYVVDAEAFVPSSGGSADCNPSEQKSQAIALADSFTISVAPLAFTQCQ